MTKKVNACAVAHDLRSGLRLVELKKKHGLSSDELQALLESFKVTRLLGAEPDQIPESVKRAIRLIVKLQYRMGLRYATGNKVPRDLSEAVKWWLKAAEHGNADAQFYLGECYLRGAGVSKDDSEAAEWLHKAAAQGHPAAKNRLRKLSASNP